MFGRSETPDRSIRDNSASECTPWKEILIGATRIQDVQRFSRLLPPGMSRAGKRQRSGRCRASAPCLIRVRLRVGSTYPLFGCVLVTPVTILEGVCVLRATATK